MHCVRQISIPGLILLVALSVAYGPQVHAAPGTQLPRRFMISEFRVHGTHVLTPLEIETVVYPFLGPGRSQEDIQGACAALEKLYHDKGFGAASVQYTPALEVGNIVELQVNEGKVGHLKVKGAKYSSPREIKAEAPSLADGSTLDFNAVTKDVVSLNQLPDRSVTPVLQPGAVPGTYDIDLNVKDSAPTHASVELNDYRSPNTTPLRVTAAVSDNNLFQTGQGIGASFELAPVRPKDSEVFTGYYLMRFPGVDGLSFMLQGTKQDSNVSTLGGSTVAGPGQIIEFRVSYALPNGKDWATDAAWQNFSQSIYLAFDYKHFQQTIKTPATAATTTAAASDGGTIVTPITYYPLSAGYSAFWQGLTDKSSTTNFNAAVVMNFRGAGSGPQTFDTNRYGADGGFIYLRGSVDHTANLPAGFQVYARVQGQVANQPLVSSEEYSGGGEYSVRGYLESEEVGDDGVFGTVELRSPSLTGLKNAHDWRVYIFGDAGELTLIDPLPSQSDHFHLESVGFGSRVSLGDHLSGSFDAGYPLTSETYTEAHNLRMTFRVGAQF